MGFKNDFNQAEQGGLKPEGDYECIITAIEERTTQKGSTGLNLTLVIRNDVQGQKFGNACLFHTLWKRKDPTDMDKQVNGYGFGQVMALGKAAALPDGKDYESLKQFCEDLLNKCVRATVKHEEYNGKTYEKISYVNPTKFSECRHVFKKSKESKGDNFVTPVSQNQQFVNAHAGALSNFENVISDDDGVPF